MAEDLFYFNNTVENSGMRGKWDTHVPKELHHEKLKVNIRKEGRRKRKIGELRKKKKKEPTKLTNRKAFYYIIRNEIFIFYTYIYYHQNQKVEIVIIQNSQTGSYSC